MDLEFKRQALKFGKRVLTLFLCGMLCGEALPMPAEAFSPAAYAPGEAVVQVYQEVSGDGGISWRTTQEGLGKEETVQESFQAAAYADNGTLYEQLNVRQQACYDALSQMSVQRVSSAAETGGYRTLTARIDAVYGLRLSGTINGEKQFEPAVSSQPLLNSLYTDMLASIVAYRYDHPEAFWTHSMTYGYRWSKVNNASVRVTEVVFGFKMLYGNAEEKMYTDMMAAADQLILGIDRTADRYTQVKAVHDALAAQNTYSEGQLSGMAETTSHIAYSALIGEDEYQPVCDGYAKAFKILCDKLQIPCVLAVSEKHMWNNVKMDDGDWYNVDLTWDDSGAELGYQYFLIGSQTPVNGVLFCKQLEHVERNPYTKPEGLNAVSFSYPEKNKEAYAYLGQDYPPLTFPDVKRSAWYYEYVENAYGLGLFSGNDKGLFRPINQITRAEFAQVMANAAKADLTQYTGNGDFSDVSAGQWYAPAVAWAKANGVMNGDGATFRPEAPITREEMCVVFYNVMETPPAPSGFAFPDDGEISQWAKSAVYACYAQNLVKGNDIGYFNPKNSTRRSEAATVFVRRAQGAAE